MSTTPPLPTPLPPLTPSPPRPPRPHRPSPRPPKNSFCLTSPAQSHSFLHLVGCPSLGIFVVFLKAGAIKHPLLASGHLVKPGARTTPSRMIKGPSLHTPRTHPMENAKEGEQSEHLGGRGQQKANCWASPALPSLPDLPEDIQWCGVSDPKTTFLSNKPLKTKIGPSRKGPSSIGPSCFRFDLIKI